jgi:copper chaperone
MSVTLTVTGMSCGGCESTPVEALEAVEGVESPTADREVKPATAEGEADVHLLFPAVADAGYGAPA